MSFISWIAKRTTFHYLTVQSEIVLLRQTELKFTDFLAMIVNSPSNCCKFCCTEYGVDRCEGRIDRPSDVMRPLCHRMHQLCVPKMGATGTVLLVFNTFQSLDFVNVSVFNPFPLFVYILQNVFHAF